MNIKVVLEYDGSGFAGWQQQPHGHRTVEAELKPIDDVRSTAEYRLHVAKALVARALGRA